MLIETYIDWRPCSTFAINGRDTRSFYFNEVNLDEFISNAKHCSVDIKQYIKRLGFCSRNDGIFVFFFEKRESAIHLEQEFDEYVVSRYVSYCIKDFLGHEHHIHKKEEMYIDNVSSSFLFKHPIKIENIQKSKIKKLFNTESINPVFLENFEKKLNSCKKAKDKLDALSSNNELLKHLKCKNNDTLALVQIRKNFSFAYDKCLDVVNEAKSTKIIRSYPVLLFILIVSTTATTLYSSPENKLSLLYYGGINTLFFIFYIGIGIAAYMHFIRKILSPLINYALRSAPIIRIRNFWPQAAQFMNGFKTTRFISDNKNRIKWSIFPFFWILMSSNVNQYYLFDGFASSFIKTLDIHPLDLNTANFDVYFLFDNLSKAIFGCSIIVLWIEVAIKRRITERTYNTTKRFLLYGNVYSAITQKLFKTAECELIHLNAYGNAISLIEEALETESKRKKITIYCSALAILFSLITMTYAYFVLGVKELI